jgi:hypothetical protein
MGHGVTVLGQHRINTSTLETTASDLSEAFNATVQYGYMDIWVDLKNRTERSNKFVELGKVERKNCPVYLLCDSFYMDKIYAPETYKGEMNYDFYGMNDGASISIYQDSFSCNTHFDSRWNNFVRFFQGQFFADSGWFAYIKEFRKTVQDEIKLLSGKHALYGDDQGDS